jgi:hypothetical protein
MHEPVFQSIRDTFLYGLPVMGLLLFSLLKLDATISAPKNRLRTRPPVAGTRADGEPLGCDPDGRLWPARRRPLSGHAEEISSGCFQKWDAGNPAGQNDFL